MPKSRKAESATQAGTEATAELTLPGAATGEGAPATQEPPAAQASAEQRRYAADPDDKISVPLSNAPDGPIVHLARSHKFKQMQIRFDGEQPADNYVKQLTDAGWKDRTKSEGVFTKQIDQDKTWQSVRDMEREFRDIANAIRQDKGLPATLKERAA
jgi:hypothetical protein